MFNFLMDSKNRNFLRLWIAQLISQFGDRIHQLALVGLIAERAPGSATELAKLMSWTILPVFLIQPFAGVLVDRWDRRTTLFVCDLVRGVLVLLIPFVFIFWKTIIPIYIIVFTVFCFSRFYVPAKMSIIPDLVENRHLLMANSLVTTTGMIAFVLGCALGGFIVDKYGARTGFFIDAATFFISGLFLFSMNLPLKIRITKSRIIDARNKIVQKIKQSFWVELREGIRYIFIQRDIRFIISVLFILLSAAGAIYVVIIVFIQQSFSSVTRDLGVLAVFLGIGLFLGALMYGKWGKRFAWDKTIFFCLILAGIMTIVFAISVHFYTNVIAAMILSLGLGIIIGPIFIASNTVAQMVSDESMRGKVFSALEIVIHFAFLVAMLVSAVLSEFIPRVWILVAVGCLFSVIGIGGLIKSFKSRKLAFSK